MSKRTVFIDLDYCDWLLTKIVRISVLLLIIYVFVCNSYREKAVQRLEEEMAKRFRLIECRLDYAETQFQIQEENQ